MQHLGVEVVEDRRGARGIGEAHVLEADVAGDRAQRQRARRIARSTAQIEDLEDARRPDQRAREITRGRSRSGSSG